jgi:methyltransferase family protein
MDNYLKLLEELEAKYGADKKVHGYMPYYTQHLPRKGVQRMLEIGCFKGASLRMWRELYPEAEIHTIDLFADPVNQVSVEQMRSEGFICHQGDQSDRHLLKRIDSKFDLIIDDGSHNSDHQQISFMKLFSRNLTEGGLYVVEDLHCCKNPFYWHDERIKGVEDTMLGSLLDFSITGTIRNGYTMSTRLPMVTDKIDASISSVDLYNDNIAFIRKKA